MDCVDTDFVQYLCMDHDDDSLKIEHIEAVVEQIGDGDLALVRPQVLLTFFYALRDRFEAGVASSDH